MAGSPTSPTLSNPFESIDWRPEPVSNIWRPDAVRQYIADGQVEALSPSSFRINLGRFGGAGIQTTFVFSDGLSMHVIDASFPRRIRAQLVADESVLLLRASLSCDCTYTVPGREPLEFRRPEIVMAHVPRGAGLTMQLNPGTRQSGVHVYIRAAQFGEIFGLERDLLPVGLRGVFDGSNRLGRLFTLPMDARLGELVEAMLQPIQHPRLQQLYLEGKLHELVALVLEAVGRNPAFAGPAGLRRRDVDLAYATRAVLDREYAAPPRFSDLAHEVGTNQNKLKILFREVFGTTMASYCVERRVRAAQALLLEGRLSIGQIAERVGYAHQSSFTAAFRDLAGMTPRAYQQHRAALDLDLDPQPGAAGCDPPKNPFHSP